MGKDNRSAYSRAGVNIDAATRAVEQMKGHIRSTHNESVVGGVGLFGGLIDASALKGYRQPVLVQSIDGVGTKMMIAEMMDVYTVGQCIVNHCVNDILTLGATPISFLDYIAANKLRPEVTARIVAEMAVACRAIELPLIGGETAEMPGVYRRGRHDVVGCVTGIVEKDNLIDGGKIEPGDILIGLPSNGLHTNGYSLARRAFFETYKLNVNTFFSELGCTVGKELLKVHRNYFPAVAPILRSGIEVHGIAHITGGGFFDNIGRLLRNGLCARITEKWPIPPVFGLIQGFESVSDQEMRRVFNLGIGTVLIVSPEDAGATKVALMESGEPAHIIIGKIESAPANAEKVVFDY